MFNCPAKTRLLLEPDLFSLFINELYHLLVKHRTKGIQLHTDITEIFILMFADDVALIPDTVIGLRITFFSLPEFFPPIIIDTKELFSPMVFPPRNNSLPFFFHLGIIPSRRFST